MMADVRRSKRLSYWLRHAPEAGGISLDEAGWAATVDVLRALQKARLPTSPAELQALVEASDKQRFELSPDGSAIRARQGHSVRVEGDWPVSLPPDRLFHGTAERHLTAILAEGLVRGRRHHVHLSPDIETARAVGARHGPAIILAVASGRMSADGYLFRRSSNGVWLTDHVPPAYLEKLP
jgi:putative RNA 2'-phosphotransferase